MKMSLFISVLCYAASYSLMAQAACVQPPSCVELGFTMDASKCSGAALKCPWDLSKSAWRFVTNSKEVNSKAYLLNYVRPVVAY